MHGETHEWLVAKKVLRGQSVPSGGGRVRLSEDDTALMESGTNIAFLIALVHSKLVLFVAEPDQSAEGVAAAARAAGADEGAEHSLRPILQLDADLKGARSRSELNRYRPSTCR